MESMASYTTAEGSLCQNLLETGRGFLYIGRYPKYMYLIRISALSYIMIGHHGAFLETKKSIRTSYTSMVTP